MPDDFDPAEHRQMVCVESGNVKQNKISLAPGKTSALKVVLSSAAVEMISLSEIQPSGADLVSQVEEIFSPTGILSRAKNFEFRPQQQEMAVAVARALQNREHLAVEAGTGVGKSLAYLIPAILFAVAQKKKAIVSTHTINLQEQLTEKDLPMLAGVLGCAAGAGEIQLRDAQGPRELSLHAPAAKGDAAERQSVHVVRGRGIAAHLRMVEGNQGRQLVGF